MKSLFLFIIYIISNNSYSTTTLCSEQFSTAQVISEMEYICLINNTLETGASCGAGTEYYKKRVDTYSFTLELIPLSSNVSNDQFIYHLSCKVNQMNFIDEHCNYNYQSYSVFDENYLFKSCNGNEEENEDFKIDDLIDTTVQVTSDNYVVVDNQIITYEGTPQNTNEPHCTACPNPVNIADGYMWDSTTDFSLKGRTAGTDINFTRTYLSKAAYSGRNFARHWFYNFQTTMYSFKTYIFYIDESGGAFIIPKNDDGTLNYPGDFVDKIVEYDDRLELLKKNNTKYVYSKNISSTPKGKLVSIQDLHGETITLKYDSSSQKLLSINSPFNGSLNFEYNSANLISRITSSLTGRSVEYSYDNDTNLINVKDNVNKEYKYTYINNLLDTMIFPNGKSVQFKYDEKGRVIKQFEDNGYRDYAYSLDSNNLPVTKYREIDGQTTTFYFDSKRRLTKKVNSLNQTKNFTYNDKNLLLSETDALGYISLYTYDSNNNLSSYKKPEWQTPITYSYDLNFNNPISITSPLGTTTNIELDQNNGDILRISKNDLFLNFNNDQFGNIIKTTNNKASYSDQYNSDGLLIKKFDARNPASYEYDQRHRVISQSFKNGRKINFVYDDYDRIISIFDTSAANFEFRYDLADNIIYKRTYKNKIEQIEKFSYDTQNRLVTYQNPKGKITKYIYDDSTRVLNKPSQIIYPNNKSKKYEYDVLTRLVKITDQNKNTTLFNYNARGDLVKLTNEKGEVTKFEYDGNSRLIKQVNPSLITDAKGVSSLINQVDIYTYNDNDQLISEKHHASDNLSNILQKKYQFDINERLVKLDFREIKTDGTVLKSTASIFNYANILDQNLITSAKNENLINYTNYEMQPPFASIGFGSSPMENTNPLKLITGDFIINRDINSKISSITDKSGKTLFNRYYNQSGNLTSVTNGNLFTGKSNTFKIDIKYDDLNRKIQQINSNGLSQNISYDSLNQIKELDWTNNRDKFYHHFGRTNNFHESLEYDNVGNIISIKNPHDKILYTYDDINQLTSEVFSRHSINYSYDVAGNRIFDSENGNLKIISNAIIEDKDSLYAYDEKALGNLTTKYNKRFNFQEDYSYNLMNKLSSYELSTKKFENGFLVNYYYDAFGRRIAKKYIKKLGKKESEFTQSFLHLADQDQILLSKDGNGSTYLYIDGDNIDQHLASQGQHETKFYVTDHLSSVINQEAVTEHHGYSAFGMNKSELSQFFDKFEVNKSLEPVLYGFAGREYDLESGLYYNRARMYDPTLGRFTQKDPIGFNGGDNNLYRYVGNNPLTFVDPSGNDKVRLKNTSSIFGHETVKIYDPEMPGNTFYADFYPNASLISILLGNVPGKINYSFESYNNYEVISESITKQSKEQDYKDIQKTIKDSENPPNYNIYTNNCTDYLK